MPLLRDILYALGALLTSPLWLTRLLRTGKWRTDWPGRLGRAAPPPDRESEAPGPPRRLLLHAVSVGEVNATRRLVAELTDREPNLQLVVATTTDTGYARARELYSHTHHVVRFPLDFSFAIQRFLDTVQPDAVALVELEVWPNFVTACRRRGIPVGVVNGRLSERSFHRYRLIRPLVRSTFASLTAVGAQTDDDGERFAALGTPADRVQTLDTMKWETAEVADDVPGARALAEALGLDPARPIVVAGSTGPGEEQMLINQQPEGAQLLLVPRKPERFEEVAALAPGIVRRSRRTGGSGETAEPSPRPESVTAAEPELFLLDTMGELRKAYALADVAVVGRSFNGQGGSDPIEPVALGKPVVMGPDHHHFAEVVSAFRQTGAVLVTREPGEALARLLENRQAAHDMALRGRDLIHRRQGATRRYAELIQGLLARRPQ